MSRKTQAIVLLFLLVLFLHGCARGYRDVRPSPKSSDALHPELAGKVLSLNPNAVSRKGVAEVLSRCPAPGIVALDGSVPIVTMGSFARFLIRMEYLEERVRNPGNGSYAYSRYGNSKSMAGIIAWYPIYLSQMIMLGGFSFSCPLPFGLFSLESTSPAFSSRPLTKSPIFWTSMVLNTVMISQEQEGYCPT